MERIEYLRSYEFPRKFIVITKGNLTGIDTDWLFFPPKLRILLVFKFPAKRNRITNFSSRFDLNGPSCTLYTGLRTTGKIRESQGISDDREKSGKVREFGQKFGFVFVFFGKLGILKCAPGLLDFDNPR